MQPKAKRTPVGAKLFDVTLVEDVVLIPSKAGNYTLGPVTFAYFDPQSGSYKTLTAPRTSLTITAPAAPQFNVSPAPGQPAPTPETGTAAPGSAAPAPKPVVAASLPAGIPRDPLPGSALARLPLPAQTVVLAATAPFAGALLLWVWFALRRAQATDPVRPRREARLRLTQVLNQIGAAGDTERAALLLAWQKDAAGLWQLAHAAPAADDLPDATWSALWQEADRSLYGPKASLPSDWAARAQAALAAKPVPGFQPLRLFLPKNLMPFAAMLALVCATTAMVLHAAELDGAAAYRQADFPAAEKNWRSVVSKTPADWIARHNL